MPSQFNLISEPWIPVAYDDGSIGAVGWRDLIADSRRIADIPTDPVHFYGIVVRFATALMLRTQDAPVGDSSPGAWQKWGAKRLEAGVDVAALDAYFEIWRDRFWLVDDTHPFLQDPAIAIECAERASTNKLFFDIASGNNHLWWTKTPDDEAPAIPFAVAAMALLGQWGYAAGGRCTARNGVSDSSQAPLRRFAQFVPHGASLFETLLMCCTPAILDAELAVRDAPVWEMNPTATPVPGQLGRLTVSTRGILLFPGDGGITNTVNTWGKMAVGESFWDADVFMAKRVVGKDEKIAPLKLSPSSVVWREVPSILANKPDVDAQLYPLVLDAVRNPLGATSVFDRSGVTVLTHFADKSKDLGWGRSELPDILAAGPVKDPAVFLRLSGICKIAGEIVHQVANLVVQKTESKAGFQAPVIPDAEMFVRQLWLDAEDEFYAVLKGESWEEAARRLMRRCGERFDEVTDAVGAPQRLTVIIRRRRQLTGRLKKITEEFGLDTRLSEVAS